MTKTCTTEELLAGTQIPLDVFSYHYYNGVSERIAGVMPSAHWPGHLAHSDEYLAVAPDCARAHAALRDRFVPGGPVWVTESGDAGGGGDTWASTYLDVLRTLNELGSSAPSPTGSSSITHWLPPTTVFWNTAPFCPVPITLPFCSGTG
ncbi:MAG: hypothetical protein V8Q30_11495 [Acutalibacteraceae bacterium]